MFFKTCIAIDIRGLKLYTYNPVPPGGEGELWLSLLEHIVLSAAAASEPDLVLVSAGFDVHRLDPLGRYWAL